MTLKDSWPAFVLMVFAVASGQMGRLGKRYEDGAEFGRKQIIVELTMLPAFGALGGALAAEFHWPIWMILLAGIGAGWFGFGTFRLLLTVWRTLIKQAAGIDPDKPGTPTP